MGALCAPACGTSVRTWRPYVASVRGVRTWRPYVASVRGAKAVDSVGPQRWRGCAKQSAPAPNYASLDGFRPRKRFLKKFFSKTRRACFRPYVRPRAHVPTDLVSIDVASQKIRVSKERQISFLIRFPPSNRSILLRQKAVVESVDFARQSMYLLEEFSWKSEKLFLPLLCPNGGLEIIRTEN